MGALPVDQGLGARVVHVHNDRASVRARPLRIELLSVPDRVRLQQDLVARLEGHRVHLVQALPGRAWAGAVPVVVAAGGVNVVGRRHGGRSAQTQTGCQRHQPQWCQQPCDDASLHGFVPPCIESLCGPAGPRPPHSRGPARALPNTAKPAPAYASLLTSRLRLHSPGRPMSDNTGGC